MGSTNLKMLDFRFRNYHIWIPIQTLELCMSISNRSRDAQSTGNDSMRATYLTPSFNNVKCVWVIVIYLLRKVWRKSLISQNTINFLKNHLSTRTSNLLDCTYVNISTGFLNSLHLFLIRWFMIS